MRVISDLGGYSTIFIAGTQPRFLMKSAATSPKMVRLRGKTVKGMTGLHTKSCEKGWAYIDDKVINTRSRTQFEIHIK